MTRPTEYARAALATAAILVALGVAMPAAAMPPGNMFPKLSFAQQGKATSDGATLSTKGTTGSDPRCGLFACKTGK